MACSRIVGIRQRDPRDEGWSLLPPPSPLRMFSRFDLDRPLGLNKIRAGIMNLIIDVGSNCIYIFLFNLSRIGEFEN